MKNDGGTNISLPSSSIFIVLSAPTEKFSDTLIDVDPLFTFMLWFVEVCESNVSIGVRTSVSASTLPNEPVEVAEPLMLPP